MFPVFQHQTEERGLGAIDVSVLQQGADTYQQLGLVKNKLDLSKVMYRRILGGQKSNDEI